jgi:hypothetical protein
VPTQDYDLYVRDSSDREVTSSLNRQAVGSFERPTEFIHFKAPTAGTYSFAIRNYKGGRSLPMHLFVHLLPPEGQFCIVEAALEAEPGGQRQTAALRSLRDLVLGQSGAGRRLTDMYYRHTDELRSLLLSDFSHARQTIRFLAALQPGIRAMVAGSPANPHENGGVTIDASMARTAIDLFDDLEARASPALVADLRLLRDAAQIEHAVGTDVLHYWEDVRSRIAALPFASPRLTTTLDPLEYVTPAGSLSVPADAPDVFSVGAVYFGDNSLEDYSSQGPTVDGRIKPDISAPTRVCTQTAAECGGQGFPGTSSSAPHVTGAAALVSQVRPAFGRVQIQSFLKDRALDRGTLGADNEYGAGVLALGVLPSDFGATMTLEKTSLTFAAVHNGVTFTARTASQTVRLSQSGRGTVAWSVKASQPWILVAPTSGKGPVTFTVGVTYSSSLPTNGTSNGSISLSLTGALNTPSPLSIALKTVPVNASLSPTGAFDTPTDGRTGIAGSVAVTGWAVDDLGVSEVQIWRDAHPLDPPASVFAGPGPQTGKIFIGKAAFVSGARPDIEKLYASTPFSGRAGWGYLMLTRGLIWDGKGLFRLYAYALDPEGHVVLLGSKSVGIGNAGATKPFGSIDTPGEGATATGMYPNTGWVLTPNAGASIPTAKVQVAIDGVFLSGVPSMSDRTDITGGFSTFSTKGAGRGLFIDTSAYADGVHTIGWLVTDNTSQADGIGSRFFTVANGSSLTAAPTIGPPLTASSLAAEPVEAMPMAASHGWDAESIFETLVPRTDGTVLVRGEELDRFELHLGEAGAGGWTAMQRVGQQLRSLPIGSHIDAVSGVFTWQPGAGFLGLYDFVFARVANSTIVARREVRISIAPQGALTTSRVAVDTPTGQQDVGQSFIVAGWAVDPAAVQGTGIDAVHVWVYPPKGATPIFLGAASIGGGRPDVADLYGERFHPSGYGLLAGSLPPGNYTLAIFARSSTTGTFLPATCVQVNVR